MASAGRDHCEVAVAPLGEASVLIRIALENKVQRRSSGGCWRTLTGLADLALAQSCPPTAEKRDVSKLSALRDLFNGHAWMPAALEPSG